MKKIFIKSRLDRSDWGSKQSTAGSISALSAPASKKEESSNERPEVVEVEDVQENDATTG